VKSSYNIDSFDSGAQKNGRPVGSRTDVSFVRFPAAALKKVGPALHTKKCMKDAVVV